MWGGIHDDDPEANSICEINKEMGENCAYHNPENYGCYGSYGRNFQCKAGANLLLYRSGVYQERLEEYGVYQSDYSSGKMLKTKPISQVCVGEVIMTKSGRYHTAIVVKILDGTNCQNVKKIDVVDSNLVSWGAPDEEIIARHAIDKDGTWGSYTDMDNYFALKLAYK